MKYAGWDKTLPTAAGNYLTQIRSETCDINVCDTNLLSEAFLEESQAWVSHAALISTGIRKARSPASAAMKRSFVTVSMLRITPVLHAVL